MDDSILDTCSICFEEFSTISNHRIVALACGHLFGKSCIEDWIKFEERKRCPECNETINGVSDFRVIYGRSVVASDEEIRKLKSDLKSKEQECRSYEGQLEDLKFQLALRESEIEYLKSNHNVIKEKKIKDRFFDIKRIDLDIAGSKMLIVDFLNSIIISQPSKDGSWGINFQSLDDRQSSNSESDFLRLHNSTINDIILHPFDALLLTASSDNRVKVVDLITRDVATFEFDEEPTCLTFNRHNAEIFYCGFKCGKIVECDLIIGKAIRSFISSSPIKQIFYLNYIESEKKSNLLIRNDNALIYCIEANDQNSGQQAGDLIEGQILKKRVIKYNERRIIISIDLEESENYLILTIKNLDRNPVIEYQVLKYSFNDQNDMILKLIKKFDSNFYYMNSIVTKLIVPHPSEAGSYLFSFGSEEGALIFDKDGLVNKLHTSKSVQQISFYTRQSSEFILVLLTSKCLQLLKWNPVT